MVWRNRCDFKLLLHGTFNKFNVAIINRKYTRRVLGVAYFCWEFCWANKPNGSAVMIHTLLRTDIELRMR
jgi:hypothetical protein